MNKHILTAALGSLAFGAALAQAPKGVLETPPAKTYPSASGGVAADRAQQSTGSATPAGATADRPAAGVAPSSTTPPQQLNPIASGGPAAATAEMGANARIMDANGDGMVSRQEWDRYLSDSWTSMDALHGNAGSVPAGEVDRMLRGTPK